MLGLLLGFRVYFYNHFVSKGIDKFTHSSFEFAVLLIIVGVISSAGYLINDIFDVEADKINKPNKKLPYSKKKLRTIYWSMNVFAIILTFIFIENTLLRTILLGTIILLYLYSLIFQKIILIGNLTIALLSATLPFLYLIFENISIQDSYLSKTNIVVFYAIVAFIITLLREIIKDKEDEKGDLIAGYKTLSNSVNEQVFKYVIICYPVVSVVFFYWVSKLLTTMEYDFLNVSYWEVCTLLYLFSTYYLFISNYKKASQIIKLTLFIGVLFLYIL